MAVRELIIDEVEPFEGGRSFGSIGAYEVVRGRAVIELDPRSPANARVTDIDQGGPVVAVESDVVVLRPADPASGRRLLLAVVPNRGSTGGVPFTLGEGGLIGGEDELRSGDGWLLENGWTVAWPGWQWDLPRDGHHIACTVSDLAVSAGPGWIRVQLQPFLFPAEDLPLRSAADFRGTLSTYSVADPTGAEAVLMVAERRGGPSRTIPEGEWGFGRMVEGHLTEDPNRVWLRGGFRPDRVYEVLYRTDRSPLVGAGLAAWRDVVSHLRHDEPAQIDHVVAAGWSQSGRFLRQLLYEGMVIDEGGRPVFDAVLPFIAGASRGEFNQRHGQPAEALAAGIGHTRPFDLDGVLARSRSLGVIPKVIVVNTASEYWRGDGNIAHTNEDGTSDVAPPAGTRLYALAGVEHIGGGTLPIALPGGERNHLDPTPAYRAILEAARAWVVDGVEPPPDQVPTVADGSAVRREVVLDAVRRLRDIPVPDHDQLAVRSAVDVGPDADRGIVTHPIAAGTPLTALVSAVDHDGNELAGIRLPELTVPLATHTGWNTLLAEGTAWEGMSILTGNSHPFPATPQDRIATGDPRPSIAERYPDVHAYAGAVRDAAEHLVAQRFLLAADVEHVVAVATDRYRRLTIDPTGA